MRKCLISLGLLALLANGCVPPKTVSRAGNVRVAVLQGAGRLTLASQSVLTVKDTRTRKLVSKIRNGQSLVVTNASRGIDVAGRTYATSDLTATSTTRRISLNGKAYPGSLRILKRGNSLLAVNSVDLEMYVKAVVPSEMLPTWPQEALKAQAVASRSFVIHHARQNRENDFDITSNKQVYNPDKQDPRTDRAVEATRGMVLFYNGELLLPFFSTCCGGYTEYATNVWETDDEFPPPVECPYCREEPGYRWQARLGLTEFQNKLRSAGITSASSIAIQSRSRAGGRITALKIGSDTGDRTIRINRFRLLMGPDRVKSGFFDVIAEGGYIRFDGRGWGHGVGMCQRGAKVLAQRGKSFKSILGRYFAGARIKKIRW